MNKLFISLILVCSGLMAQNNNNTEPTHKVMDIKCMDLRDKYGGNFEKAPEFLKNQLIKNCGHGPVRTETGEPIKDEPTKPEFEAPTRPAMPEKDKNY